MEINSILRVAVVAAALFAVVAINDISVDALAQTKKPAAKGETIMKKEPSEEETKDYILSMFTKYKDESDEFKSSHHYRVQLELEIDNCTITKRKQKVNVYNGKIWNEKVIVSLADVDQVTDELGSIKLHTEYNNVRWIDGVGYEQRSDNTMIPLDSQKFDINVADRLVKAFTHLSKLCKERKGNQADSDPFK